MSEKLDPLKLAEESGAKLGEEMERELRNLETASGGGGANLNVAESIAATTPDNSEAGTGKADGLKEEVGKNLPEKSPAEAEKSTVELAGAIEIKKDGTEKAGKKELLSAEKLKEAVKKARTEYLKSEIDAKKADTVLSRLGKLRERLFSKKKEKTDDEKLNEFLGAVGSSS